MKRLTLDETWEQCLLQRKYIADNADDFSDEDELKEKWLADNGFPKMKENCFFCEYNEQNNPDEEPNDCEFCPGKLIEAEFHCELVDEYNHWSCPIAFYAKLKELNKIRLAKK